MQMDEKGGGRGEIGFVGEEPECTKRTFLKLIGLTAGAAVLGYGGSELWPWLQKELFWMRVRERSEELRKTSTEEWVDYPAGYYSREVSELVSFRGWEKPLGEWRQYHGANTILDLQAVDGRYQMIEADVNVCYFMELDSGGGYEEKSRWVMAHDSGVDGMDPGNWWSCAARLGLPIKIDAKCPEAFKLLVEFLLDFFRKVKEGKYLPIPIIINASVFWGPNVSRNGEVMDPYGFLAACEELNRKYQECGGVVVASPGFKEKPGRVGYSNEILDGPMRVLRTYNGGVTIPLMAELAAESWTELEKSVGVVVDFFSVYGGKRGVEAFEKLRLKMDEEIRSTRMLREYL